jgi:hypothetical protein
MDTTVNVKRFKPKGMVEFGNRIVGPTGARLATYVWQYTMEEVLDSRGEMVERRVSDWDKAAPNEKTGREIVHQFTVVAPDGQESLVSLESALRLLGYLPDTEQAMKVKSLAGTLKTRAKNLMLLDLLREDMERLNEWYQNRENNRLRLETAAPTNFDQWAFPGQDGREGHVTLSVPGFSTKLPAGFVRYHSPREILHEVQRRWVEAMLTQQAGPEPKSTIATYNMQEKERDLLRYIAKADKTIEQFQATAETPRQQPEEEYAGIAP